MSKKITYKKIGEGQYEKIEEFEQKSRISLTNLDREIGRLQSDEEGIEDEIKRLQDLKKRLEAITII